MSTSCVKIEWCARLVGWHTSQMSRPSSMPSKTKSTFVEMPVEDHAALFRERANRDGGKQVLTKQGRPLVGAVLNENKGYSGSHRVYAGKLSICEKPCCTHAVVVSQLIFYHENNYLTDDNKPSREELGAWIRVGRKKYSRRRQRERNERYEQDYDASSVGTFN